MQVLKPAKLAGFIHIICMKENITKSRTCTYNINYHVVWSVKYRKKIITPGIEKYLKETAMAVAADKGFTLHLFEAGEGDHIHCFVSAPPKLSITDLVKYLKGITGRKLMDKYPELKTKLWKGELWNHSYYVETIGSVSEDNIRRYIEKQSKAY
jgi:putative transposase